MNNKQDLDNDFEIPRIIFDQLKASRVNGFPFFAYMGIKKYVMIDNTLMLHLPWNKKKYEVVDIIYDVGADLYKIQFRAGLPLKIIDGVFFDQMAEIIAREVGVL